MYSDKISVNLNVPYINVTYKGEPAYLCANGVLFTDKEFQDDYEGHPEEMKKEYDRRSKEGPFFVETLGGNVEERPEDFFTKKEEPVIEEPVIKENLTTEKQPKIILLLSMALMAVSLGSMFISTVHTATYLFDYVDVVSAWIMSTVITLYSSIAFEVVILFHDNKRHILSVIFAFLWSLVTLFSMLTTVSIFYDRYNFDTLQDAEVNNESEGSRLALEILKTEEASLKEAIEFKKDEIEYRRKMDYATHQRTLELDELQKALQTNLDQQKKILLETPDAAKEEGETKKKESLFAFLGREFHLSEGILEFIMSTLSAVFINLISPLSVTVVVSFLGGMKKKED